MSNVKLKLYYSNAPCNNYLQFLILSPIRRDYQKLKKVPARESRHLVINELDSKKVSQTSVRRRHQIPAPSSFPNKRRRRRRRRRRRSPPRRALEGERAAFTHLGRVSRILAAAAANTRDDCRLPFTKVPLVIPEDISQLPRSE